MMQEKSEDEGHNSTADRCPLCGQHYTNRYEATRLSEPNFRRDAKVCKHPGIGGRKTYYVHLPTSVRSLNGTQ